MSLAKVRSALITALTAGDLIGPPEAIVWENRKADPKALKYWASVFFMFPTPSTATLGPTGQNRQDGFVQIDLNYPTDSGDEAAMAKYVALSNALPVGRKLLYQGQSVILRNCGRSHGRIVGNYYRVTVSLYFYAHINR
jgi:hypothetical protein